ncbi:MAG: hypothetical protein HYZ75_04620 [Elusimicrobia bacterium]|nr:hypothetical protein [Elusimicrobiota bacterium]
MPRVLGFGLLAACVWWRPLFAGTALFGDLLYKLFFPNQAFLSRTVLSGELPLWNPHAYGGVPFAANLQSAVFYPFTYLALPLDFPRALAWSLWAHTAMAGLFMAALAQALGLSRRGALAAGVMFALNGNFLLRFAAPSHFHSYVWLPLILLAGFKKDLPPWLASLLMAAAACLQLFAGHPQFLLYSGAACLICAAASPDRRRWLRVLAGAAPAFLALGAVQLQLTGAFLGESVRAAGFGYDWSTMYSLTPRELLAMLALPQWNAYFTPSSGDPRIVGLYFGPFAAAAAVWGLRGRQGPWRPFAALIVLGLLLSLGRHLPVYPWLYDHVGFLRMIRFPPQAAYLACLGVSVLAGLGVERLPERRARWLTAFIAADLLLFAWRGAETIEPGVYADPPASAAALERLGAGRIMLTPRTRYDLKMSGETRAEAWRRFKEVLFPNFPTAYGIDAADGQEELRYARYEKVLDLVDHDPFSPWIDVLAVTHVLTRWDMPPKFRPVATGTPNVYHNPAALPRAYVVHETAHVPDEEVLAYVQRAGSAALRLRAVSPRPLEGGGACVGGEARVVEPGSQRVRVETESPCPGWLVLADAWDAGWRAEVGGVPEEVLRVNLVQRAVRVPAGRSTVEFRYRPRGFATAAWVSGLAWLTVLILFALPIASGAKKSFLPISLF